MLDTEPISTAQRGPGREQTQSLPDILKNYLRHLKIESCTPATIGHKERQLWPFLGWLEAQGHTLLAGDLTSFDILGHLEDMAARGNSVNTRHTRLRSIRAWCNWMVQWELIEDSPCRHIKSPRLPREGKGFITGEQFHSLLDLCPLNTLLGARRAAMLWMLATTGVRRSELWGLQLADLDWDRGVIHVRKGKGQKERWVPFAVEAQRPTLRYLHQRRDDYPCLWVSEEGTPIKADHIGLDLGRLMQRAGVEVQDVCHVFRRTWAAGLERQNVPGTYIDALAGWSTSTMRERYVAAMKRGDEAIEAARGVRVF